MKGFLNRVLIGFICLTAVGCTIMQNTDYPTITARVVEVKEESIMVEEIENGLGLIHIGLNEEMGSIADELSVNDVIQIKYDGAIMESYPLQIGNIKEIIIEENEDGYWDLVPGDSI